MHALGTAPQGHVGLGRTRGGHRVSPAPALPCHRPGQGGRTHAAMALAHLSEHLNLPALYDGAIQLLPCPVGICASFKSYKPKTL